MTYLDEQKKKLWLCDVVDPQRHNETSTIGIDQCLYKSISLIYGPLAVPNTVNVQENLHFRWPQTA